MPQGVGTYGSQVGRPSKKASVEDMQDVRKKVSSKIKAKPSGFPAGSKAEEDRKHRKHIKMVKRLQDHFGGIAMKRAGKPRGVPNEFVRPKVDEGWSESGIKKREKMIIEANRGKTDGR